MTSKVRREFMLAALATARTRQGVDDSSSEDTLIAAEIAAGTSPLARPAAPPPETPPITQIKGA